MIITGIVLALVIIVALVMHYMSNIFSEFNDHFLHLTVFLLVFLIGAAIYLSYAMPTVAGANPFEQKPGDIKVYRDTPTTSILDALKGQ